MESNDFQGYLAKFRDNQPSWQKTDLDTVGRPFERYLTAGCLVVWFVMLFKFPNRRGYECCGEFPPFLIEGVQNLAVRRMALHPISHRLLVRGQAICSEGSDGEEHMRARWRCAQA